MKRFFIGLLIVIQCCGVASAVEIESWKKYVLESNISDQVLVCELESLTIVNEEISQRSKPQLKIQIERASENLIFIQPIWDGVGERSMEFYSPLYGFYRTNRSTEKELLADNDYGKLAISYNNTAQQESRKTKATVLSLTLIATEMNQSNKIYAASGFCQIDSPENSKFPFKNSIVPPSKYGYAKMYYFPDLKLPENFEGLALGGIDISMIVNQNEGINIEFSDWKSVFTKPKFTQYSPSLCYNPRHLLVFFTHKDQPISYVEVCLQCKGFRASDFSNELDIHEFAKVVSKAGLPVSPDGISLEEYIRRDLEHVKKNYSQ